MTYLSDWKQAEEEMLAVIEAHPDCTHSIDCTAEKAEDHVKECPRYRRDHGINRHIYPLLDEQRNGW